jgi:hypothetical protein
VAYLIAHATRQGAKEQAELTYQRQVTHNALAMEHEAALRLIVSVDQHMAAMNTGNIPDETEPLTAWDALQIVGSTEVVAKAAEYIATWQAVVQVRKDNKSGEDLVDGWGKAREGLFGVLRATHGRPPLPRNYGQS